jgi:hypothetical protein
MLERGKHGRDSSESSFSKDKPPTKRVEFDTRRGLPSKDAPTNPQITSKNIKDNTQLLLNSLSTSDDSISKKAHNLISMINSENRIISQMGIDKWQKLSPQDNIRQCIKQTYHSIVTSQQTLSQTAKISTPQEIEPIASSSTDQQIASTTEVLVQATEQEPQQKLATFSSDHPPTPPRYHLQKEQIPTLVNAVIDIKQQNAKIDNQHLFSKLGIQVGPKTTLVIPDHLFSDCQTYLRSKELSTKLYRTVYNSLRMKQQTYLDAKTVAKMTDKQRENMNVRRRIENITDDQREYRNARDRVENMSDEKREAKNARYRAKRMIENMPEEKKEFLVLESALRSDAELLMIPGTQILDEENFAGPSQEH